MNFLSALTFFLMLVGTPGQAEDIRYCDSGECCPPHNISLPFADTVDPEFPQANMIQCLELKLDQQMSLLNSAELGNAPQLPCNCEGERFNSIYNRVIALFTQNARVKCNYAWRSFDSEAFRKNIERYLRTGKIACAFGGNSMCTSAIFMAFLIYAKEWLKIPKDRLQEWATVKSSAIAWSLLSDQARPDLLVEKLKIGVGKILRRSDIPNKDWPREGDLVQIWRQDGSGHAVLFAGYVRAKNNNLIGICYWSSQKSTGGYGKSCELLTELQSLTIGRFIQ